MRGDTTFYHYSPICHLPAVLREGLCKGDVAHHDPRVQHQAVSLTVQADPDRLGDWATPFKTGVRYVCRVPADAARLEPQRATWLRLGVSRAFVRRLDPHGHAKWWWHYFGTIPRGQFEVQLRGRAGYVTPTDEELAGVADVVERERAQYEYVSPPDAPYLVFVRPLDASRDNWLMADHLPADRLLRGE